MPHVVEELPHHGLGIVAVGALDQQRIEKLRRVAVISQRIFVAPGAFDFTGQRQPHASLAQYVERGIGQGHVFFENGAVADERAQALGQNEIAVAQAQQVLE